MRQLTSLVFFAAYQQQHKNGSDQNLAEGKDRSHIQEINSFQVREK
jgi:hypothetical protein